jgi:hypothetical protein
MNERVRHTCTQQQRTLNSKRRGRSAHSQRVVEITTFLETCFSLFPAQDDEYSSLDLALRRFRTFKNGTILLGGHCRARCMTQSAALSQEGAHEHSPGFRV